MRLLSLAGWAFAVLRELRLLRKEVRSAMATLQEQVTQLGSTLDTITQSLGVVGTDVANLVTEIAALNAGTPAVDLGPLQTKAQAIADSLTGIRQQAEGVTPTTTPPTV